MTDAEVFRIVHEFLDSRDYQTSWRVKILRDHGNIEAVAYDLNHHGNVIGMQIASGAVIGAD